MGRGLNWISGPAPALMLDLEAWQKFFGFDKNGAYADMSIEVDLDALTLTWSFSGGCPAGTDGEALHPRSAWRRCGRGSQARPAAAFARYAHPDLHRSARPSPLDTGLRPRGWRFPSRFVILNTTRPTGRIVSATLQKPFFGLIALPS